MAKKIFATNEEINSFLHDTNEQIKSFISALTTTKFQHDRDDELSLKLKFDSPADDRKAKIIFTPIAWKKMYALVYAFSSEVQWHGTVKRLDKSTFLITDILVFPHEVTGTTVVSDQKEYEDWLDSLNDETFNSLRFHGHSHVDMGVTPSGVDMNYRRNLLNNFGMPNEETDLFYIFLITNKSRDMSGEIYDLQNNALYSTSEIEISVEDDMDDGLISFLKNARQVVKHAYSSHYSGYKSPSATTTQTKKSNKKDKGKKEDNIADFGYGIDDYSDGFDDYSSYCDPYWASKLYGGSK